MEKRENLRRIKIVSEKKTHGFWGKGKLDEKK